MKKILISVIILVFVVTYFLFFNNNELVNTGKFKDFKTDLETRSVELDKLIMAGDGKDSIPALSNPSFVSMSEANLEDDVLGVLIDVNGEKRYYPYNILVWHEIVNDYIGDNYFAVTFCPLCRSAIVFDRNIGGKILEFGVSGFLYESNLLMYDRQTESFWSQAGLEAIVGKYTGTELKILPMQLLSFGDLKEKYSDIKILSEETGYDRDYSFYPYREYDQSDELLFPVSVNNTKFKPKEVMLVIPYNDVSIAFPQLSLEEQKKSTLKINGQTMEAFKDDGHISITLNGEELPTYYEMWFSWATQHKNNGLLWSIEQCLTEIKL